LKGASFLHTAAGIPSVAIRMTRRDQEILIWQFSGERIDGIAPGLVGLSLVLNRGH
jgi:hypothetical protein